MSLGSSIFSSMASWSWTSPVYAGLKAKDGSISTFSYDDTSKLKKRHRLQLTQLTPAQAGVLLSGVLILCCWRFVSERLSCADRHGFQPLVEIWTLLATALLLGQTLCRVLSSKGVRELAAAVPAAARTGSSSRSAQATSEGSSDPCAASADTVRSPDQQLQAQEQQAGQALVELVKKPIKLSKSADSDILLGKQPLIKRQPAEDSTAVLTQAPVAKLPVEDASQPLQPLIKKLRRGSNLMDVSQTVFEMVELLLSSREHVKEFVELGGIRALLAVIPKLNHELQLQGSPTEVLQATMQITWALMAVANEGTADRSCEVLGQVRAKLVDDGIVIMLGPLLKALLARSGDMAETDPLQPVLRNLCVLLFKLCDSGAEQQGQDPQAEAVVAAMQAMGLLPAMLDVYSGAYHTEPAVWAAATLAVICQRGLLQPEACDELACSMLGSGSIRSLCSVLWTIKQQPDVQMLQRGREVLHSFVHYLLEQQFTPFIATIITEHLGGALLSCIPQNLARHVLLNILSTRGQEIMASVEADWECDVPLLLAQLLPLDIHMALPPPALLPDSEPCATTYTDQQVCRMLLVRRQLGPNDSRMEVVSRLEELVLAFFEELQQSEDGSDELMQSDLVMTVQALVAFLMAQELDLQQVRQASGADMEVSTNSSSNHSSIEMALESPHGGLYVQVLGSAVSAKQQAASEICPGDCDAAEQGGSTIVVPDTQAGSSSTVSFQYEGHTVVISKRCFRLLKESSSMLGTILKRADPSTPITLLRVPRFTAEANAWVLQCAAQWLVDKSSLSLSASEALQLWPAAEFLQLTCLQAHCEDVIAAALGAEKGALEGALELCCWHSDSSSRLVHLVTTHVMRGMTAALTSGALRKVSATYRRQFVVCFFEELRDRLVAFLTLNAGAVAEPEVMFDMEPVEEADEQ